MADNYTCKQCETSDHEPLLELITSCPNQETPTPQNSQIKEMKHKETKLKKWESNSREAELAEQSNNIAKTLSTIHKQEPASLTANDLTSYIVYIQSNSI
jgi:hypothetical protein